MATVRRRAHVRDGVWVREHVVQVPNGPRPPAPGRVEQLRREAEVAHGDWADGYVRLGGTIHDRHHQAVLPASAANLAAEVRRVEMPFVQTGSSLGQAPGVTENYLKADRALFLRLNAMPEPGATTARFSLVGGGDLAPGDRVLPVTPEDGRLYVVLADTPGGRTLGLVYPGDEEQPDPGTGEPAAE